MSLPTDAKERKETPIMSGVLDYFPDAIAYVARVSKKGNDQHNPGQPLHWAWGKSNDHADCAVRHLMERGSTDSDGELHSAKAAWRALANLQEELVAAGLAQIPRGARTEVVPIEPANSTISGPVERRTYDSTDGKVWEERVTVKPRDQMWSADDESLYDYRRGRAWDRGRAFETYCAQPDCQICIERFGR